jgi:hypothetical protein
MANRSKWPEKFAPYTRAATSYDSPINGQRDSGVTRIRAMSKSAFGTRVICRDDPDR